jgi:hypothetical protein
LKRPIDKPQALAPIEPEKPDLADLEAFVANARALLAKRVELAGLREDPIRHILAALSIHLDVMGKLAARFQTVPVDRIVAEVEASTRATILTAARSIAASVEAANRRRTALRTALVASGVAAVLLAMAAAGAYRWGWAARDAAILRQCAGISETGCTLWIKPSVR